VKDSIARLTFSQSYINWSSNPLEVTYYFPVEKEMVVNALTIELGDQVIEAKIMKKEEARV